MRLFKLILAALLTILGGIFIYHNLETLTQQIHFKFDLYIKTFQSSGVSLWVLLAFTFGLGVLTSGLYLIYEILKQRQTNRHLRHNLEILSSELQHLKPQEAASAAPEPASAASPEPPPAAS